MRTFLILAIGVISGWLGTASLAQTALTVTDRAGVEHRFTLDELDALAQVSFETETIWTTGVASFSGVALSTLLDQTEMAGENLRLTALNDYFADLPAEGIGSEFPIVATRMDGTEMSVRDKGPFWLVYPYDASADFRTEAVYSRSVWQLSEISVIE